MPSSELQAFMPRAMRRAGVLFLALLAAGAAHAQAPVGDVTHLSGLLTARNAADGGGVGVKLLAAPSVVHAGDVLTTAVGTYARIRFLDDAELTLGPDSQVGVVQYSWNPTRPQDDRVVIELVRGSLQSVTGQLGKRNHDAIEFNVPGARLAVHGTTFTVAVLPQPAPVASMSPGLSGLAAGIYVDVTDGMINLSNKGGTANFSAGQFGFTPTSLSPPLVVPKNPAIQFAPPPSFDVPASSTGIPSTNTVDCEVR
jgi:hypothetical protein